MASLDSGRARQCVRRKADYQGGIVMLIAGAVLSALVANAAPAQEGPFFPRGVYWPQERLGWLAEKAGIDPWEYSDQLLGRLHDDWHCNLVWVVNIGPDDLERLCGLAAGHDIKVAGSVPAVYWWRQHRTPEFAVRCAERIVADFGDVENLYAYVLVDEPRAWELTYLNAIRREIARLDPARETLIVTMRGDTAPAISRTGFPIITSDIYPFFFEGDPNGPNPAPVSRAYYRLCANAFVEQCEAAAKTYWMMPGAFPEVWGDWYYDEEWNMVAQPGAYLHWRMPTVGETRWQVWEALAAGSKGIVWFVLFPPRNERTADSEPGEPATHSYPTIDETVHTGRPAALLNPDSTPTAQLIATGEAFADLERLAPALGGLRRAAFPVAFTAPPLHCQTLQGPEGALYAVVVNDDTDEPTQSEVRILPGVEAVRDLRTGADVALAAIGDSALRRLDVTLEAGDGTVLELVFPPARRPLAAAVEDFESPLITGSVENAEVRARRLPWGVGWEYELVRDAADEALAGTLTCSVAMLTGDPTVHRPSGPIYIVYSGRAGGETDGVTLAFSTDGEAYEGVTTNEFATPVELPRSASHVRFEIVGEAALSRFVAVATEAASP